jgi:hypothetical protein
MQSSRYKTLHDNVPAVSFIVKYFYVSYAPISHQKKALHLPECTPQTIQIT